MVCLVWFVWLLSIYSNSMDNLQNAWRYNVVQIHIEFILKTSKSQLYCVGSSSCHIPERTAQTVTHWIFAKSLNLCIRYQKYVFLRFSQRPVIKFESLLTHLSYILYLSKIWIWQLRGIQCKIFRHCLISLMCTFFFLKFWCKLGEWIAIDSFEFSNSLRNFKILEH